MVFLRFLKIFSAGPGPPDPDPPGPPGPPDPDRLDAWHHPNGRHRQLRHGAIREARDHGGGVADGGDTSPGDKFLVKPWRKPWLHR